MHQDLSKMVSYGTKLTLEVMVVNDCGSHHYSPNKVYKSQVPAEDTMVQDRYLLSDYLRIHSDNIFGSMQWRYSGYL